MTPPIASAIFLCCGAFDAAAAALCSFFLIRHSHLNLWRYLWACNATTPLSTRLTNWSGGGGGVVPVCTYEHCEHLPRQLCNRLAIAVPLQSKKRGQCHCVIHSHNATTTTTTGNWATKALIAFWSVSKQRKYCSRQTATTAPLHRNCVSQLAGAIDHVDLNNMPTDWMSIHWRHQLTSSSFSFSFSALFLKTQSISETLFLRSTLFDCSVHYNKPTGSGADFNWSLPICRTWLLLSCFSTVSANVKVKVILLAGTICVCVCLRASSSTLKKVVIRERKRFCAGGGGGSLVHWVNWWCKGKVCLWLAVAALSCDICVCRWSDWSDFPAATATVVLLYRCQLLLLLQRNRSTSFSSSTNCLSVCSIHCHLLLLLLLLI